MNLFHRLAIGGALSLLAASAVAIGAVTSQPQPDNITLAPARSAQEPTVTAFYWFDQQKDRYPFSPGAFSIDTGSLPVGFHSLHAQILGDGVPTWIETAWFIKTFGLKPGASYTSNIYIDGYLYSTQSTPAGADGTLSLSIDVNDLPIGVHLVMGEVISPDGIPTSLTQSAFMRVPTAVQLDNVKLYYLIDGVPAGEMTPSRSGEVYSLDIDLTSLPSGVHSIASFLAGADGFSSSMETAWFVKIPVGGEGVKSYEYWLNDNPETLKEVVLDKVADPCQIVALLEMPQEPFCSKRYEFAVESGKPVVYGQNDYQIRFRDLDGRFTTGSGRYTDVRVKKEVTPEVIPDNARTRIENLAENDIRLFTFSGQTGDSIGISLDAGAMWELYSPDGEALITRIGAESVNYSTRTLTENGIYYLAVHDISSHYGKSVNIDFDHIARHAIVDFTPDESADDNTLIVDVTGNGFESLEAIKLRSDKGDVDPTYVSVSDNNHLHSVFELAEKRPAHDDYRLVASFDDEEKGKVEVVSAKAMNVDTPEKYDISVTIDAPFIARTPYQIDIIVENRSNKAYYGVPFVIAAHDMADGTKFETLNFAMATSEEDNESPFIHTDDLLGTGIGGIYLPAVIPYLAPREKKVFTLGLTSRPMDYFTLYSWAGTPWSIELDEILKGEVPLTAETLADKINDDTFTVYDIIDIVSRVVAGVDSEATINVPTAEEIAAAASLVKNSIFTAGKEGNWVFDAKNTDGIKVENVAYTMGNDSTKAEPSSIATKGIVLNNVKHLIVNGIGNTFSWSAGIRAGHLTSGRILYKIRWRRRSRTPKRSVSFQSGDPNDMHGYESPSGTRYIGLDVKDVRYTIEFENDPEIANAPASRIAIENQIDLTAYDPATLTPVSLRLGNKEIELPAQHHFVRTLDMRPEIQAIAELTFDFDTPTGLAKWKLRSLDPLTMDETKYMDSGILPVNDDSGRGLGFITYSVDLREGLADGTTIANMATIVFDDNDPIDTPVWENILDYKRPTARIVSYSTSDGINYDITVEGTDAGAGIWYYDLYARSAGSDRWELVMSQIEDDTFTWNASEAVNAPEFAIVAMDHAANRGSEAFLSALTGDADGNGTVDINDAVVIINYYLNPQTEIFGGNADVTHDGSIDTQDATGIITIYLGGPDQLQNIHKRNHSRK